MGIVYDQSTIMKRLTTYLAIIASGLLLSACGHSQMSLQPEIKSPQSPSSNVQSMNMQQNLKDAELNKQLPEMNAVEYERLGDTQLMRGDLYGAYMCYDKALRLKPERIELEYKKGLTLLKSGNGKEAAKQFQTVLDAVPGHALSHEGMGRALLVQNKVAESKPFFIRAIRLDEGLWRSHNCLGMVYDREGRQKAAVAAYKRAIELNPNDGSIYNNLGMSYLQAEAYMEALKAFQQAVLRKYATERTYNNIGLALAYLGYHQGAFEAFKKAGGEARAYNNLGCFYMETGQLKKAVACFEKAIAAEPSYYARANENLKKAKAAANTF